MIEQMEPQLELLTVENFSNKIRRLIRKKDMSPIDAISEYCTETEMDPELAAELIDADLFSKIQKEAQSLHLIEPVESLPFDGE